ncbi:MAG: translocation/assembly module TamB domain-containing protein, partial [Flavobacteriaceae bacterium]|nr:translocation/assembly module TamB domain-containing protein [Flavobacteriaceae bacterium]
PPITLEIDDIDLQNNYFLYTVGNARPGGNQFNPNAVELTNLNLKADKFVIKDQSALASIQSADFRETSGINVNQLTVNASITENRLDVNGLNLQFNGNSIKGDVTMRYPSLDAMINSPETASIDANIDSFNFNVEELYKFQPELRNNPNFQALSKKRLSGSLAATGNLSSINVQRANIDWGNNTNIRATGTINNITNPDQLSYNFTDFKANSTREDLKNFVDEEALNISLPETVSLQGSISGNTTSVNTNIALQSSQGSATLKGKLDFSDGLAYEGTFDIKDYNISELLGIEGIGNINLTIDTKGEGRSIYNLTAEIRAEIASIEINQHTLQNVVLTGNLTNGKGTVVSNYQDEVINFELQAFVELDSIAPKASIELDLIGANLQGLGYSSRDIRTGLDLKADFQGDLNEYDFTAAVDQGVVVYDAKTYLMGDINASAHVRPDTTSVTIRNKILNLNLRSNSDPMTFSKALQDHIYSYFYRDVALSDTIQNPVNVLVDAKISQSPVLNEVFLVNLKDLDTIVVKVDFVEKERRLDAHVSLPRINYSSVEIDSLKLNMHTDKEEFTFDLAYNHIEAGPFSIQKTEIKGNQLNNELHLQFTAYHDNETLINIKSEVTGSRDSLVLHVLPEDLIFNKKPWQTPPTNRFTYLVDRLEIEDFEFRREEQSVIIDDNLPGFEIEHVGIDFYNFELSEFLAYLNPDDTLATGNLNGDLVFEEPLGNTGFLANLVINDLAFMDVDMGRLQMNGNYLGSNSYAFNMDIEGGQVDLDLVGDYTSTPDAALLDLNLRINEIQMSALEGFTLGAIKDGAGSFSGGFKVNGTLLEPEYQGALTFNNADFTVAALNSPFTLPNETMEIKNNVVSMSNFTLKDERGNNLVVSGTVGTEVLLNPTFDLEISASNFQALDATEEDNEMMYGTAVFDAQASINGDLQIPVIEGRIDVLGETDVTYVMPSATVNIEERDGIVVFVNKENPDAILTRSEEQVATLKGFDIDAFITVDNDAVVTVVIDQNTGDNFRVYGKGEFNYTMEPNGRMTLAGTYEIAGGHYDMSLYNLVNRKFTLAPGGQIRWSGDPFDAELDITAIYDTETSASPLMAAALTSVSPDSRQRFRQVFPFLVYLNIEGELMRPQISFALDMPEDEQGALGGEVYSRIQQVNDQEGELNRQVFSLLVLNRFYPEVGSDGSRGGFASIARDNLNDALADQLNIFSDKILGDSGFDLDFNLDTFTDYQGVSPQERTQLDIAAQKKFFDDRFIVRVGSEVDVQGSNPTGEKAPLIGNVSLEYIITEDGRYRLRGFRRDEFENVIDGQTIVSGIALIFTQEFNQFSELWDALFKSQREEDKTPEEIKKEKMDEKVEGKQKEDNDNSEDGNNE